MKRELIWISLALYWLALLGFAGPALISASSTEAVVFGLFLLGTSVYATYRFIRKTITTKENLK